MKFLVVTTPEMREAVYRLRYKVYVEEYKYEKPEDHPDGQEKDAFDDHSLLFAALDSHGRLLGTSRLILNGPAGLPALGLAAPFYKDPNPTSRKIVEVSRLALEPSLKGSAASGIGDIDFFLSKVLGGEKPTADPAWESWQKRVMVLLGLIQIMFQAGQALAVTDYFMVSERSLWVLLRRHKIHFRSLGPPIEHHGEREIYRGMDWEIGPPILAFQKRVIEALGLDQLKPPAVRDERLAQVEEFELGGFEFRVARKEADLEALYGLREALDDAVPLPPGHKTYVQRHGRDRYDSHAVHLVAKRQGKVVGTLRLVLNSAEGFPCLPTLYPDFPDRNSTSKKLAELGRFGLAQPYMAAFEDLMAYSRLVILQDRPLPSKLDRQTRVNRTRAALILMGLFRLGYRVGKNLRVTKVLVMLEIAVAEVFARRGFYSHQIGDPRQFGGHGAPYLVNFAEVEPALLDFRAVRAVMRDIVAMTPGRKDYDPVGLGAEEDRLRRGEPSS